jgi:translin
MTDRLDTIADEVHQYFDAQTKARDEALSKSRTLIRHCSHAIRAVHREDDEKAQAELAEAEILAKSLIEELAAFPNLYYAGYTQDALKEYAEASAVIAVVKGLPLPSHTDLGIIPPTYLKGLAETIGEMRRRCLDMLRKGHAAEVESILQSMEDIFGVLETMDYPDAVTFGLRRLTDISRSIIERTRGDITMSLRQEKLQDSLMKLESRFENSKTD